MTAESDEPTTPTTIRCATCGGVAHPASGCQYTETFLVCGPCAREAWRWLRAHINGKGGRKGLYFYEYAAKHMSGQP